MTENVSLSLIQSVVDSQKDLIVIFKEDKHIITNHTFNKFFNVSSIQDYNANFGAVVDNFVPHPLYFHKEKVQDSQNWFDAIMQIDEAERIVSMMTPSYDPFAFSVNVDRSIEYYKIVTFTDITQDLIKRIMSENRSNIDEQSGAYNKKYFLQVAKNYEDAAAFNEKILGLTSISIDSEFCSDEKNLQKFVESFNCSTRQDDMIIRWDDDKFLLVYLIDNEDNAKLMTRKFQDLLTQGSFKDLNCKLTSVLQKESEGINSLIQRVSSN